MTTIKSRNSWGRKPSDMSRIGKLAQQGIELMHRERKIILGGDFDKLAKLQAEKIALMKDIEKRFEQTALVQREDERETDRDQLRSTIALLSRRAKENLTLLQSAKSGVAQAQEALASATLGNNEDIGLYSPQGTRIATAETATSSSVKF